MRTRAVQSCAYGWKKLSGPYRALNAQCSSVQGRKTARWAKIYGFLQKGAFMSDAPLILSLFFADILQGHLPVSIILSDVLHPGT